MANYQLGPVIGKIGGVEIITEDVTIGGNESRTWELPDGWEAGFWAMEGHYTTTYSSPRNVSMFGKNINLNSNRTEPLYGFGEFPATVSTGRVTWSGTVTLIRTA